MRVKRGSSTLHKSVNISEEGHPSEANFIRMRRTSSGVRVVGCVVVTINNVPITNLSQTLMS